MTRVLITGASGFVGRACVAEARRRGLEVVALVRNAPVPEWGADKGVRTVRVDLSDAGSVVALAPLAERVDAVIHAAAHLGGDAEKHVTDTVLATENLTQALGTKRVVLVSSIAVYDTMRLGPGDVLDETSPIEEPDTARDSYTAAKLRQEEMCRAACPDLWILRPGAIYGPGRTWHALMGFWAGKLHVVIGSDGDVPTTHVDHVAAALVTAAETPPAGVQTLNVIDDDLPTRARFLKAHRKLTGWPRVSATVPFGLWLLLARMLGVLGDNRPGLLRERVVRARLMPLRFPNRALRKALGGQDSAPFEDMLARSVTEGGT